MRRKEFLKELRAVAWPDTRIEIRALAHDEPGALNTQRPRLIAAFTAAELITLLSGNSFDEQWNRFEEMWEQKEAQAEPPQSPEEESTETMFEQKLEDLQRLADEEPQWMKNDRERDTMVENGLHNMNKPLEYGEVAVACESLPETD